MRKRACEWLVYFPNTNIEYKYPTHSIGYYCSGNQIFTERINYELLFLQRFNQKYDLFTDITTNYNVVSAFFTTEIYMAGGLGGGRGGGVSKEELGAWLTWHST